MLTDREFQLILNKFHAQIEPLRRQVQELQAKVEALTDGEEASKPRTRRRKRIQQTEENAQPPH